MQNLFYIFYICYPRKIKLKARSVWRDACLVDPTRQKVNQRTYERYNNSTQRIVWNSQLFQSLCILYVRLEGRYLTHAQCVKFYSNEVDLKISIYF